MGAPDPVISIDVHDPLDAELVTYVLDETRRLATVLRDFANEITGTHVPAVAAAALPDWCSTARLTYDVARVVLQGMLEGAATAANFTAFLYDCAVPKLEAQKFAAEVM